MGLRPEVWNSSGTFFEGETEDLLSTDVSLRDAVSSFRAWLEEHRRYLKRSGISRAIILDAGTPESATLFVEVTSKLLLSGVILLFASGFVAIALASVTWLLFGVASATITALIAFASVLIAVPTFQRSRRYRISISCAEWFSVPDRYAQLQSEISLAALLDHGHTSTNAALCRAMRETGSAEKVYAGSHWEILLLTIKKRTTK